MHGVAALVLLSAIAWPDGAAAESSWPRRHYNPRPLTDDLLLPLPCDGAMAFRRVTTGGPPSGSAQLPAALLWLLDVEGSFQNAAGQGSDFLLGKHEVTSRQYQVVLAVAAGRPCPVVDKITAALPIVDIRRGEAAAFAEALSGWWAEHAETLPDCTDGATPCLPRVEATVASVRLPTEKEWEYALRGGTQVTSAEFAARRYPMPRGLARSAWYQGNANELRGIGLRDPNPLGLHDMLGNAEEILADNYQEPRGTGPVGGLLVRGGSAWTPAGQLDNNRRIEQPTYNHTADTGFRVLAHTPVIRTPESARHHSGQGESRAATSAPPTAAPSMDPPLTQPPPKPPSPDRPPPELPPEPPSGALSVRVDQPATLWLGEQRVGEIVPGEPLHLRDLPAGEHQLVVRVAGRPDLVKTVRVEPTYIATLDLRLPSPLALASDATPRPPPDLPPNLASTVPARPRLIPPGLPFEPAMIALPGGILSMGSPDGEPERDTDEGPRRAVAVAAFAIGRTEVTRGQYRAFAEAQRRLPPSNGDDDLPMAGVSWHEARDYAEWLSSMSGRRYRLPTEAEWEYATRAGTTTPFWTGHCIDTGQANYNGYFDYAGCGAETGLFRNQPVAAGSLPENPFGLHEVHGNLAEWTADCWRDNQPAATDTDASAARADCTRRVLRGGFFDNKPYLMRSANRSGVPARIRRYNIGFRVARDL